MEETAARDGPRHAREQWNRCGTLRADQPPSTSVGERAGGWCRRAETRRHQTGVTWGPDQATLVVQAPQVDPQLSSVRLIRPAGSAISTRETSRSKPSDAPGICGHTSVRL